MKAEALLLSRKAEVAKRWGPTLELLCRIDPLSSPKATQPRGAFGELLSMLGGVSHVTVQQSVEGSHEPPEPKVSHPIFARVYDRLTAAAQDEEGPLREELLAGLSGTVIEVGAGNGHNFVHYPAAVTRVVAVEPESYLQRQALERASEASVEIEVVDGVAERLPAEDGSFDAAVACFVLCSVSDQGAALAETRRVLRPGGKLRFLEHVVANSPGLARAQRIADRTLWPLLAGGCHAARDTGAAIECAGFEIERVRQFPFRTSVVEVLVTPHILGVARRSAEP